MTEGPDGFIYFTTSQYDPPEGTPRPEYDFILRLVPQAAPPSGLAIASEWQGPRPQEVVFDPTTTNATQIVAVFCAGCHGPGLRGGLQRGLLDGKWQFAKDDEGIRRVMTGGLGDKGMPAFGAALNPGQTSAVIRYIRDNERTSARPVEHAGGSPPSH